MQCNRLLQHRTPAGRCQATPTVEYISSHRLYEALVRCYHPKVRGSGASPKLCGTLAHHHAALPRELPERAIKNPTTACPLLVTT